MNVILVLDWKKINILKWLVLFNSKILFNIAEPTYAHHFTPTLIHFMD